MDHDDRIQNQKFHSDSKLLVNKPPYFRVWKHKISEKDKNVLLHTFPHWNIPDRE